MASRTDRENSYFFYVPFEKGVSSLGRAVGDKDDVLRSDPDFLHEELDRAHDTFTHAVLRGVSRRDLGFTHELQLVRVDCHRVGESAADIDADSILFHRFVPLVIHPGRDHETQGRHHPGIDDRFLEKLDDIDAEVIGDPDVVSVSRIRNSLNLSD